MINLNFNYNGVIISVQYKRVDDGNNSYFDVYVDPKDNSDIEQYTSSNFRISISHRDSILSYKVNGPTDLEIKSSLIPALFMKENIDFEY